ncbi:MAG: prepilin-type N-terminal cleavage/methylation domain-containing protein [Burkholderiales bacterium]|nr:prepilin-type N-terminal cleavage/methylation domain-containing protein [Burkholderiales bacterium]
MAMPRSARPEGFTLVEIAVVIVVLSLLLAMIAGIATALLGQQRREATRQRLTGVETALALFVSQNRRLPCPADGRIASTAAGAGDEARNAGTGACQIGGAANVQTHGVVPWRTLGLAEQDATDGWGNRLTYRVAPELTLAGAMDYTACDPGASVTGGTPSACASPCPSGTWPAGCTHPTDVTRTKGLKVRTNNAVVTLVMDSGAPVSTGAAYVVISHGENGVGGYGNSGLLQSGSTPSGTLEAANNHANVAFAHATSAAMTNASAFVDDFPSYNADASHFDDFVLRPSILAVATKAQLGPRAH